MTSVPSRVSVARIAVPIFVRIVAPIFVCVFVHRRADARREPSSELRKPQTKHDDEYGSEQDMDVSRVWLDLQRGRRLA